MMTTTWDTERGSELARRTCRYVAETMPPEANLDVLSEYEDAAIAAQRAGDWRAYQERLRQMCRTAKQEALKRGQAA